MTAALGPALVELDRRATEADKPYGIITADCSFPFEYDDGIAVTPLPSAQEAYAVSVFSADTSRLYNDDQVTWDVLRNTQAAYYTYRGERKYEPMLDIGHIKAAQFVSGTVRDAFITSFVVGAQQPPSQVELSFGKVEVLKNYGFRRFGNKCSSDENFKHYGRAASLVLHHLGMSYSEDEETAYRALMNSREARQERRGSIINQAYMVAAGHLVAQVMSAENALAIYRRHNPLDSSTSEFLDPTIAYFSANPGLHAGLGLNPYSRTTSPLRRSEDYIMLGLLKARASGRELSGRDHRLVETVIRRLNQRESTQEFRKNRPARRQKPSTRARRLQLLGE